MCNFLWWQRLTGVLGLLLMATAVQADPAQPIPTLKQAISIAAGNGHSCVIVNGGAVKCWGSNDYGQLGNGTTARATTAVDVIGVSHPVLLALGGGGYLGVGHSCALMPSGRVKCWGGNLSGQLGNGTTLDALIATDVLELSEVTALAAGARHSCAIVRGGEVKCWGDNQSGQLGNATTIRSTTPVDVIGVSGAKALALGGYHSCAVLQSGKVKCWGANWEGQLGIGVSTYQSSIAVEVVGVEEASAVAAREAHSCAVIRDGKVKCWGRSKEGQLGNGRTDGFQAAVEVVGLGGTTALALGGFHSCAIVQGHTVKCWGHAAGLLANGTTANASVPVEAPLPGRVTALAAGGLHSCALIEDGTVQCWGSNTASQLGNGERGDGSIANWVADLKGVTLLAKGMGEQCGIVDRNVLKCWSGKDGKPTMRSMPVDSPGGHVSALATAWGHQCALVSGGRVKCWGGNGSGQLGNGNYQRSDSPVDVIGISGATALAAGSDSACTITNSSTVKCWGLIYGTGSVLTPVEIDGLGGATALAIGSNQSCVITAGGKVKCWGSGHNGELGHGSNNSSSTPVEVLGIQNASALALGSGFSCALEAGGTVKCWGRNDNGQLGNGTQKDTNQAVEVIGVQGATAIVAGNIHACALVADGKVKCWGKGQLGNGLYVRRDDAKVPASLPVEVIGVKGATALLITHSSACALIRDGRVKCWGENFAGELGWTSFSQPQAVLSQSGLLFNWAEQMYPHLFSPAAPAEQAAAGYVFRQYGGSNSYLAIKDGHVYYLGPSSAHKLLDVGSLDDYLPQAILAGF